MFCPLPFKGAKVGIRKAQLCATAATRACKRVAPLGWGWGCSPTKHKKTGVRSRSCARYFLRSKPADDMCSDPGFRLQQRHPTTPASRPRHAFSRNTCRLSDAAVTYIVWDMLPAFFFCSAFEAHCRECGTSPILLLPEVCMTTPYPDTGHSIFRIALTLPAIDRDGNGTIDARHCTQRRLRNTKGNAMNGLLLIQEGKQ